MAPVASAPAKQIRALPSLSSPVSSDFRAVGLRCIFSTLLGLREVVGFQFVQFYLLL